MSTSETTLPTTTATEPRELRRVALATVIGTTFEWYDFFLYANAAGLIFAKLYFEPAGSQLAILLSFGSVGVSFLFRPFGAFIAGHFGDILGRRAMLVITLFVMGGATMLIGLLPTYSQIGIAAPIILILLRIMQGISAGGEWGGAALMAVEHAPDRKRGLYGAFPQIGVPLGLLLASGMLALMARIAPGQAFLDWGWRVPFLLSIVLVVIGYMIRRNVEESPVFKELQSKKQRTKMPIVQVFRKHWVIVILGALTFAGNSAAGYMTTGGYIQNYATDPNGPAKLDMEPVLLAITLSAVVRLIFTFAGGVISDWIGRRRTYIIGWVCLIVTTLPLFMFVDTGNIWMLTIGLSLFSIGNGLTYGQQSAFYAELFPASIRYSGVSITYAIGAILGGAFAPLIAEALVQSTGTTDSVIVYLIVMTIIAFAATLILKDRTGIPLGLEHEEEQSVGAYYGQRVK